MIKPRLLGSLFAVVTLGLAAISAGCGDDEDGAATATDGAGAAGAGAPTGGAGANGGNGTGADGAGGGGAGGSGTGGVPTFTTFAEMCAASGVVFCDDFEGGWDPTWMEDGGDVEVVSGSAVEGEGASILELSTYENIQSSKLLRTFDAVDRIHVRFDMQYADDYDNTGGSHGPILGGSNDPPWGMFGTAGLKPNGDDFFVLNFEPMGTVGDDGEHGFYAYFVNMEQSGDGNYWGNTYMSPNRPPPLITPGMWQCAEYSLTLNDPEAMNGTAEFWIDGVYHGSFEGLQWRTDPGLHITTFALDSYNHMNDGPIPAATPNRVRYDNFVLSTEAVGCL